MYIHVKDEFLCLPIWTEEHTKENYQNGCHLKTTSQNHLIFDVHMWGTYVHMCTKYKVSMSNHVPGGGVHR